MELLRFTLFLWRMPKDKRYTTVKNLISGGYIKSFREIFDTIPKSVVYKDLGINSVRFNDLLDNVDHFVLKDIFRIGTLIGIDEKVILDLLFEQYRNDKEGNKRK